MLSHTLISQLTEFIATFQIKVFLKPFLKFLQIILTFLSILTNDNEYYPRPANVTDGQVFDYVIIGAGTAGCVVANRLTEDPNTTVLLIEAGGVPSLISDYLGFFPLLDRTEEEWGFSSTNDYYTSQAFTDKNIRLPAGRLLGGSSSISYNLYTKGAPADFDRWCEMGNEGWDYKSIEKYYKKAEYLDDVPLLQSNTSSLYGKSGPIHIRRPEWDIRTRDYLKGFQQAGYKTLFDVNGYERIGYGRGIFNSNGLNRQSTAIVYLRPIKNRSNIYLLLNTLATKINVNGNKVATGVEVILPNDIEVTVRARKEVILCAGVINSPKLLLLSGVGPASKLREHNINVIVDSPRVGKNFMDHPLVLLSITGAVGFLESFGRSIDLIANLNKFANPLLLGYGALNKSQSYPDYRTDVIPTPAGSLLTPVFYSSVFAYEDEISISYTKTGLLTETLLTGVASLHPKSQGSVELRCKDPKVPPIIKTGYYSNPDDLENHARYLQDYVAVTKTNYFRSFNAKVVTAYIEKCDGLDFESLEYWKCFLLNSVGPMFDFAGTCAMGPEGEGVVDAELKVRGVSNLRVVDASVMPTLVSANIGATVVMIAEKASDMIKKPMKNAD